jgi:hypothetical protein
MRFLVIILVFINIGVWTIFNQDLFYNANSSTGNEEIDPDKMHLLTPHQLSKLPKVVKTKPDIADKIAAKPVAAVAKVEASKCYVWGTFTNSNINKARSFVEKLALKPNTKEHSAKGKKRYWVYLPPLKNAEAAKKKAAELKASGISELFVLQGNKSRHAISFGVFGDEQLANKLLKDLNSKGIKAVKKTRGEGVTSYSLRINKVSSQKFAKLSAQQSSYPKTNLKTVSCL